MILRFTLLCLLALPPVLLLSQDEPLLYERFSAPDKAWPLGEYTGYTATIDTAAGELVYQARSAGAHCFSRELFMEEVVRFSIEAKLRMERPAPGQAVGICWSANPEGSRYYAFQIRPEGEFRLISVNGGVVEVWQDWKRDRRIRPAGQYNFLRLEKVGRTLTAFINGKEVLSLPYQRFQGKYQGLVFEGLSSWRVDYFRVEHPPVRILLAEGPIVNAASFPLDSIVSDSTLNESAPRVSPDGRYLYFTISPRDSALRTGDIWFTHWQGDTIWTPPAPLPDSLNNSLRNELFYISPDHRELGLTGHPAAAMTRQGGDSVWRRPIPLNIPQLRSQSAPPSFALSADKTVLILSLTRPDGFGARDLYVCFEDKNGWTAPRNLGPDLNTWGEEMTPYLLSDNETLYFASSGRPGYGQVDIYMSQRKSNTWTAWTEPRNLGPGINGPYWETHYLPLKNPRRAYLSSQDSTGDFDLYSVRIPEDFNALGVVRVFGQVINAQSGARLTGKVHFRSLSGDTTHTTFATLSPGQGYQGLLPFGQAYEVHATVLGLFPIVDTLDLRRVKAFREVQQDLFLRPLAVGQTIQLQNVYFKRAQAELLPESYPELDRLVLLMNALPNLTIEIRGHTDNIGMAEELLALSDARAQVVRTYLTGKGIARERTTSRGFGATMPVASNENPATRHLNRRVEFQIMTR